MLNRTYSLLTGYRVHISCVAYKYYRLGGERWAACTRPSAGRGRKPGAAFPQGFSRAHTQHLPRPRGRHCDRKTAHKVSPPPSNITYIYYSFCCITVIIICSDWLWDTCRTLNDAWLASSRGFPLLLVLFITRRAPYNMTY